MIFSGKGSETHPASKSISSKTRPDITLGFLRIIVLALTVVLLLALFPSILTSGFTSNNLSETGAVAAIFLAVLILVFSVRKTDEWKRAIVLRFGKFRKVKGPGLFFIVPLVDRIAQIVDIRIRVSDFSTQKTLTGDSVTVNVDALCYWLVWDPQKAVLEVESYVDAVVLLSKSALRNAVASHDLSTFLERGDLIERQIQGEVDKITTEWGITVLHIEITDIQIPEPLQDSLSRMAKAEREKKARILLAEAEIEIAKKLEEAIAIYAKNENTLKLKILTILNEGLKAGNSMMLVPNSITEELKTRDVFGLAALNEIKKGAGKETSPGENK